MFLALISTTDVPYLNYDALQFTLCEYESVVIQRGFFISRRIALCSSVDMLHRPTGTGLGDLPTLNSSDTNEFEPGSLSVTYSYKWTAITAAGYQRFLIIYKS